MKTTEPLREAIEGAQPAIDGLCKLGARCMEQVLDKAGIVSERWLLPNGLSVIVYGTPHWRDIYVSVAPRCGTWSETLAALATFSVSWPPPGKI